MKFIKKYWYLLLVFCFFFFGILFLLIFLNKNDSLDYYYYVKDNSLILFDKKNSDKVTLTNELFSDEQQYFYYSFVSFFNDRKKIVYVDRIDSDSLFSLNIADVQSLFSDKLDNYLIARDVYKFMLSKNGILFLVDDELYYYDYEKEESMRISDYVVDFAIAKNSNNLYFINEDNNLYKRNLENDDVVKVNSNIDSIINSCDNILYASYIEDYSMYKLYANDNLISDNVYYYYDVSCDNIYFAKYDGKLGEIGKSEFKEIKKFSDAYKNDDGYSVIVLGFDQCVYCEKMLEYLDELSSVKKIKYNYININEISDDELNSFVERNDNISLKSVPILLIIKDGVVVDKLIGFNDDEDDEVISELLSDYGLISDFNNLVDENISTYKYDGNNIKKIANGIVYASDEDNFNHDNYLTFSYESDVIKYYLYDRTNEHYFDLNLSEYSIYSYNYLNNSIVYYDEDDNYYYTRLYDKKFVDETKLGKNLCQIEYNENTIYYINNCSYDNEYKGSFSIFKDNNIKLVSDDVSSILVNGDKVFYIRSLNSKKELYMYKESSSLISDDAYDFISLNNNLFFVSNVYDSSIYDKTLGDLYYINSDNVPVKIDTDIVVDFMVSEVE